MMALVTFKFRKLWPTCASAVCEQPHALAKGNCLAYSPRPDAGQRVAVLRFRIAPMHGQCGAESIQLEHQVGMAGRNQLMVYHLVAGPEVAFQAFLRPQADVFGVVHAEQDIVRMGVVGGGVRTKPFLRWAMAGLAGHTVGNKPGRRSRDVTGQTAGRRRRGAELEYLRHALGAVVVEYAMSLGVLIPHRP